MSLATNVQNLATRIATEIKAIRTAEGDLTALTTTAKANLVAAINELQTEVSAAVAGSGNASIDDASTTGAATWSSQKISDTVAAAVQSILGGTPQAAYDTLTEIAAAMAADDTQAADLLTQIGNRVRFDAVQTLTAPQQAQARTNIGAAALADVAAATEGARGTVELATTTEATTGTDTARAVTPAGLKAVADTKAATSHTHTELAQATEAARGTLELATAVEVTAGTDAVRAITPVRLKERTDILATKADVGDTNTNFVTTFEAGLA